MPAMFDMKLLGDKELQRGMAKLPGEVQNKVMRGAIRKSAARLQNEILLNASGRVVNEDTGRMVTAFEMQKPGTRKERDGTIVAFVKLPSREELGIPRSEGRDPAKDTEYYPTIVEYGQPDQPPQPFMRMAVDQNYEREIRLIGADLGSGIARRWRRLTGTRLGRDPTTGRFLTETI
jgi:HK97 gp10 family phage protein